MTPSSFINCFPYWIERRPDAFVAHMDEFPEFTFSAPSVPELIAGIQTAFLVTLENRLRKDDLPTVHDPLPGEEVLILTPTYAAKVMLIIAFKQQDLSTQEFARRVGCLPQEGSRLLKLTHPTKIDTIHAAFAALRIHLYCVIEDQNPPKEEKKADDKAEGKAKETDKGKDTEKEAETKAKPKAPAKPKKPAKNTKAARPRGNFPTLPPVPGEELPKKKRGPKPRPKYDEFGNPIIYTRPTRPPKVKKPKA